jgi:hypothetical protein
MSLAMSDLLGGLVAACTAILVIQLLKLSDLGTESRNLFPKDYEVIHTLRIALGEAERGANPAVPGDPEDQADFAGGQNSITFPRRSRGNHLIRFENLAGT